MKNLYWLSIMLFVALLFESCETNEKIVEETNVYVDVNAADSDLKMSDLYSGLEYVRLETISESLISQVYKIIFLNDQFLIVDKEATKIFLFDKTGKFFSTIGGKGVGPNEFVEFSDVTVDKKGERIFVLDNAQRRIQIYGFDGKYQESKAVDFIAHEMEYVGNDIITFYCDYSSNEKYIDNGSRPNILQVNLADMNVNPLVYVSNDISFGEVVSPFSSLSAMTDEKVTFFDVLTNRVFILGNKGVEKTLLLNFGEQNEIEKYLEKLKSEQFTPDEIRPGGAKAQPYTILMSCLPNMNYCLFNAIDYGSATFYQIAYSIDNGRCVYGKASRKIPVVNDIDNCIPFSPYSSDSDCVYGLVEPFQLIEMGIDVSDLFPDLKEDDNPIVVIAHTKGI